jgi:stage II sporulation protein D
MEDYVSGVVTGESSVLQSDEALKAMAVAARSYAARLRGRHSSEGFDFCSTTHCQRFVSPASARARTAAKATAGEMLWFDGKPAMALYSRSCGGRSESSPNFPYLAVHDDPYCKSEWTWQGSGAEIVRALQSAGLKTPDVLESIGIVSRTASGRAAKLSLSGGGRTELLAAGSFRFAMGRNIGWNTIRSDLFEVKPGFVFHGRGEGHGIGLCQRGADEMGARGRNYHEILAFYYPHTLLFQWTRLAAEHLVLFTTRPNADRRVLALAEQAYASFAFPWPKPPQVQIRIYPNLDAFRNATGEPGWVAARTSGTEIEMQPFDVLQQHGALEATVRHEMLHAFVESAARPGLPVWFREGLVEWLLSEKQGGSNENDLAVNQRHERTQAQARVADLARRYGRAAVLRFVTDGLPH